MSWTERTIGAYLSRHTFQRRYLVVPNCQWTGNECDLLVVTPSLRIVDVEIKTSRADLRADSGKDKWWHSQSWQRTPAANVGRDWPPRVWKHYYCLPAAIWQPEMLDDLLTVRDQTRAMFASKSGVLLIREDKHGRPWVDSVRRAKANSEAKPITAEQAIDIARLANLRMWDALLLADKSC